MLIGGRVCLLALGALSKELVRAEVRRVHRALSSMQGELYTMWQELSAGIRTVESVCAGLPDGHDFVRERVQEACQLRTEYVCSVCGTLL